ncbi:flagellar biosynthetic protein FliO [Clostridium hydrogeniformans]|uniref:flagellar biosynthetic protein FliO n=1 Tax=Clostridium hydrogeniformans TaxID=349933 RepID=UPI000484BC06|nr:flagellar biosynthetic protein FliO [Clostridium hydrogeniformans]
MNYTFEILKVLLSLSFIILLLFLTLRLGEGKFKSLQNNKFLKVLDKTSLSKEASLSVVKIGDEAYVLSVTQREVKIIKELSKEELKSLEESKEKNLENLKNTHLAKLIEEKLKIKGRTRNDK